MTIPTVRYTDERLSNGLRLVISEDHLVPVVAVNIWYDVGSKHEQPGKTGFAHLFEHVMFQGSRHVAKAEHIALIQAAGGSMNGTTWLDRTNYYETVPSNQLELALWLEADRMGTLLDALSQENLDNQRAVVKNEKRSSYDNQPYGSWQEKLLGHLYPESHPYHHPTIGSMEDLDAASLADVSAFFRTFYAPNNAVLSIVGDVDPGQARASVERYFGPLAANPAIPAFNPDPLPPTLGGERRETVPDRVPLTRIYVGYRAPTLGDPRLYALEIAAQVLAGGKGSRLHRRLVRDEQIAQDVAMFGLGFSSGPSVFMGWATVRPDAAAAAVEAGLFNELARIGREPVSDDELARAKALIETDELAALQRVSERADRLSMYATLLDDPDEINRQLERYLAVTPEDVRAACAEFAVADNRVVLTYVPAEAGAEFHGGRVNALDPVESALSVRPVAGPPRPFTFPAATRGRLSGGLRLLTVHLPGRPLVSASLYLPMGAVDEPAREGGATVLAARALTEGTLHRDAVALTEAAERLGASLRAEAGWDATVVGVDVPAERLGPALELLAELAREPAFPDREVERLRDQRLNDLLQARVDPARRAEEAFIETIYAAGTPYARVAGGRRETVVTLDAGVLRVAYARRGDADRAAVVIGGDLAGLDVTGLVEPLFGDLAAAGVATGAPVEPPVIEEGLVATRVRLVHRPGAVQSELRVGHLGLPRRSPDYHAVTVMAMILGGLFNSRLNMKLREEKGYTYGAAAGFDFRRFAGPFSARAAVNTDATVPALADLLSELQRFREAAPSEAEMRAARDYLVGVFPLRFETPGPIVSALGGLVTFELPADELDRYRPAIDAVTAGEVLAAARAHLHVERLAVIVVGDADAVGSDLEKAGFGDVEVVRDEDPAAVEE